MLEFILCDLFSDCEYNTHKLCVDRVLEQCQGKKTKKRGSKIMEKIRKPSTNNTAASKLVWEQGFQDICIYYIFILDFYKFIYIIV